MDIKGRKNVLMLVVLIIIFSLGFRLLFHYKFHTSALLYVGFPFFIAVILIVFTDRSQQENWKVRYWNHTRSALIVMLASSAILFEGFLCVLMFMPIYFGVIFLIFFIESLYRWRKNKKGGYLTVHILPLLIVISSFEGINQKLSFARYNEVSYSKIVGADIAEIKENLKKPILLGADMPWFLWLFPMPYKTRAETLVEGDIHRSEFRYHRWFFTNTHKGHMSIKIAEVGEDYIRTEWIEDTSYIAHYLTLHGTLIKLEPISEHETRVTLSISYNRKLDPAWYFSPLERFGVKQTAGYLIDKVIYREEGAGNG